MPLAVPSYEPELSVRTHALIVGRRANAAETISKAFGDGQRHHRRPAAHQMAEPRR